MKVEHQGEMRDILDALNEAHATNLYLYRDAAIQEISALRAALEAIAKIGGNLPDDRLTWRRGAMVVRMRGVARAALARSLAPDQP